MTYAIDFNEVVGPVVDFGFEQDYLVAYLTLDLKTTARLGYMDPAYSQNQFLVLSAIDEQLQQPEPPPLEIVNIRSISVEGFTPFEFEVSGG